MAKNKMPKIYIGKEQAYVKHTILRTYLQRLFMIVGHKKEVVINYVDCFAGPWKDEGDNLSDTSIFISLEQMAKCQQSLKEKFRRDVTFRALYIEKNPVRFNRLQNFLAQNPFPSIEAECRNGDYTELLSDIVSWCGNHFTFFFVDPTGWLNVVSAETMKPLLQMNAEFLINLMYDFVNRFVDDPAYSDNTMNLFGKVPGFKDETPEQRREILLTLYRKNLRASYRGRSAFVPIEKPGKKRVHYYLVYLTRNPVGLDVFKSQAEKMEIVQRNTQQEFKLRKQLQQSKTADLFGDKVELPLKKEYSTNKLAAKQYLLTRLSKTPTLIDNNLWADFLEDSDLYPGDFNAAMKELVKEGLVRNMDADVSRRRTRIIKPGWPNESERWELV